MPNKAFATRLKLEELEKQGATLRLDRLPSRSYFGATYLLDAIGEITGVTADLKESFPADFQKIQSLAYYLILETESPMYRFSKWAGNHFHTYGQDFPSQRISELFDSISEEAKMSFLRNKLDGEPRKSIWLMTRPAYKSGPIRNVMPRVTSSPATIAEYTSTFSTMLSARKMRRQLFSNR